MNISTKLNRRNTLVAAVSLALGTSMAPQLAAAKEYTFSWTGYFIMLDSGGNCLNNTSTAKGSNQCVTPIDGTLVYDDVALTGSMTINSFQFFNGASTLPASAVGIDLEAIGDGMGGTGTLMLSNMLFNWNTNNGIPVSLAFDADGIINTSGVLDTLTVGNVVTGVGAVSASDGTYVGTGLPGGYTDGAGYLDMGPMPLATTAWNTTATGSCLPADCMTVNPSGALPLVLDVAPNNAFDGANAGGTIGGNPMADGPFTGFNATFAVASMTLTGDGAGPAFTAPANLTPTVAEAATPTTAVVNIGSVNDEPGSTTVQYSTDGGSNWINDTGTGTNNVTFNLTETVNTFQVQWRVFVTASPASVTLSSQSVSVTINDTTAPVFTSLPSDVTVSVASTADPVIFEGPTSGAGSVTASDATDPAPLIEWSLDNLNWTADTLNVNESSSNFGAGANTVYWRVTDAAVPTPNVTTYQQTVTLNLPTGIVGQPCTIDPDLLNTAIGNRQVKGSFTMRDPAGSIVSSVDPFVTGTINTAAVCTDESCTTSGATLSSPTPFYGNLWTTNTIRLFNQPGTYSFNAIQDGNPSLGMTVGANQLGAHMLFDWSVNRDIDVVLVWNYGCGSAQLVTSDPDGDGIIGTRMVDGPFQGFNAAFDITTQPGQPPITTGGYSTTIPAVNNPVANTSPLPITAGSIGALYGGVTITANQLSDSGASTDSRVVTSCVGGCFDFSVSGRTPGETIQVALPLSEPIPFYSLYRKYNVGTNSWADFVVNATDSVKTAPLNSDGSCPEPGAGDYSVYTSGILAGMLEPGNQCVQLTITDGGPNDADGLANGIVVDPSGVGLTSGPSAPRADTSGGGGGCSLSTTQPASERVDLWLLGTLLAWFGVRKARQQ